MSRKTSISPNLKYRRANVNEDFHDHGGLGSNGYVTVETSPRHTLVMTSQHFLKIDDK